nr:type VI secretion system-associated FHA domain protein TagH [uncultured Rhodopila sp.]
MPLSLTVLRCPPTVAPEVRQVGGGEYSIGRGSDNDWVLADPAKHLSKRHCVIAFRHGAWQVAGTSSNGTFINRGESPLEAGPPRTLADGDRLILGAYEIEVRITEEPQASRWQAVPGGGAKPASADNPFDDDPFAPAPYARGQGSPGRPGPVPDQFSPALPADFDPLLPETDDVLPGPVVADHSPAISDAISLPSTRSVLPDDWDLDDFAPPPAAAPPPPPVPPPAAEPPPPAVVRAPVRPAIEADIPSASPPAAVTGNLLAAFLRGAGVADLVLADPVQTMQQLGGAFRALVSGIRQALIARSEVKREFRIEATMIQRRGNNLLKFSANDDDALIGLLGAGRQTGMGPEEAITDALKDIRLHELATMTAMQSAVRALLVRMGPDQIRDAKDQGGGLALLGNRKAKAWDAYEALHAEILGSLSDNFDSVFGKRFAQAYEQAMQELLNRRDS